MGLVVPDVAELTLLEVFRAKWASTAIYLCLYQNNYTPVASSLLSNFTEATFSGYAPAPLGGWDPVGTEGGKAVTRPDPVTFTKATGVTANTIYGYFVKDASNNLLWAERDPAGPVPMTADGAEYVVQAFFSLFSEN